MMTASSNADLIQQSADSAKLAYKTALLHATDSAKRDKAVSVRCLVTEIEGIRDNAGSHASTTAHKAVVEAEDLAKLAWMIVSEISGTVTTGPQVRIRRAISEWPGSVAQVSAEAGISDARLRAMIGGPTSAGYRAPSEADALRVETAVKALLRRALQALD